MSTLDDALSAFDQATGSAPVNNPGALKNPGGVGFQQFATPQQGQDAIDRQLQLYGKRGINDLAGIVSTWAPAMDKNQVGPYIRHVAQVSGLDPFTPLNMEDPTVRSKIARGIIAHENVGGKAAAARVASSGDSDWDKAISAFDTQGSASTAPQAGGYKSVVGAMPPQAPTQIPSTPTQLGPVATTGVAAGKTVGNLVSGLGEFGLKAYSGTGLPGSELAREGAERLYRGSQRVNDWYTQATKDHPIAQDVGEFGGNVVAGLALPEIKGMGLVSRLLLQYPAMGGMFGAAQQLDPNDPNYWVKKSVQTGTGVIGGVVGGAVGEAAGKVAGAVLGKAGQATQWAASKLGIGGLDQQTAADLAKSSPELQQAVAAAAQGGKAINKMALQRQIEADSIGTSLTEGQATGDPIKISEELNFRRNNPALVQHLNDQDAQMFRFLDGLRSQVAPNVPDVLSASHSVVNAAKQVIKDQDTKITAAYKALADANGGNLPMDGQMFAAQASRSLAQNMKSAFLPKEVNSIMNEFLQNNRPMTFENFENLRTILAAEARKADRAGDGNAGAAVSLVRNALESMPIPDALTAIKPLADTARGLAKQQFDMFRDSPAMRAIDSRQFNEDTFLRTHVINASPQQLTNFVAALHDRPDALQSMKAGVISHLHDSAESSNQTFLHARYNDALDALGSKREILFAPEELKQLQTVGNVANYTHIQPRGHYVNNSNTGAGFVQGAATAAAHMIDAATGLPIPVASLSVGAATQNAAEKASRQKLNSMLSIGAGATGPGVVERAAQGVAKALPRITVPAGAAALSDIERNRPAQSNP